MFQGKKTFGKKKKKKKERKTKHKKVEQLDVDVQVIMNCSFMEENVYKAKKYNFCGLNSGKKQSKALGAKMSL